MVLIQWRYIHNPIYNPILGLVKIFFLVTLLKLRSRNRLIIVSLWALIVVNALFIVAATCGSVFMCRPIYKYWHKDALGICANAPQYIYGVIGVTIATDSPCRAHTGMDSLRSADVDEE
jgi:hypothetical protein